MISSVTPGSEIEKTPARWQADLALAFVALIWGSTFVLVKQALNEISTMYFLALRFGFASLCMAIMFWRPFRRTEARVVVEGLKGGTIAGLFLWLGYLLQSFGLKYTTAGNSGFLTGMYIVLVPFLSALVYRRPPKFPEVLGLAVAVSGMVLLAFPSVRTDAGINLGDLLTLGCAVAFSFHLLVLGYFSQRQNYRAVALGQIVCAAVLSCLSLAWEHPRAAWSMQVVFAILSTGLFATALAFALQTWGQRYTTATRTVLLFSLEPVFALLTAALVGGEKLTVFSVGGGTLVLAGILLVEIRPKAGRLTE